MVRIATQLLMGLMLLFGTVTLTPRLFFHLRQKNRGRALYLFLLWILSLAFGLAAFYYAALELRG
ncbi:MAG: hypothetical protein AB1805_14855 [Nitrospirota bacterium]